MTLQDQTGANTQKWRAQIIKNNFVLWSLQDSSKCLSYLDEETTIFITNKDKDDTQVKSFLAWNLDVEYITVGGRYTALTIKREDQITIDENWNHPEQQWQF